MGDVPGVVLFDGDADADAAGGDVAWAVVRAGAGAGEVEPACFGAGIADGGDDLVGGDRGEAGEAGWAIVFWAERPEPSPPDR